MSTSATATAPATGGLGIINSVKQRVGAGRLVPPKQAHLKRFPFVFVVDISSSTGGGGANADIHAINRDLANCVDALRNPPAGSDLAKVKDQLDVTIITYSTAPKAIVEWEQPSNLPVSFNFQPSGCTETGAALSLAIDMISARLDQLHQPGQKIKSGTPHIFHITDGEPTDMKPGTPVWDRVAARIQRFTTGANPELSRPILLHFISPNGCRVNSQTSMKDENGQAISGQQALAKLSGAKTVIELTQGAGSMPAMVKAITMIITTVSSINPSRSAVDVIQDEANKSNGALKTTAI